MRVVIQRVKTASVHISGVLVAGIGHGMLVLAGIEDADEEEDVRWLVQKLAGIRIFSDEHGKMNKDINESDGEVLLVSQFTLHASTKKGNRPSFIRAARPEKAIPLYNLFHSELSGILQKQIPTGQFGAMMEVSLVNDGPVTIVIDSRSKE